MRFLGSLLSDGQDSAYGTVLRSFLVCSPPSVISMFCRAAVWGVGLDVGGVVVTIAGELFFQALEIDWPIIYVIEGLREGVDTCPLGLFGQEMAAV
jgi:hypothetical protein